MRERKELGTILSVLTWVIGLLLLIIIIFWAMPVA